MANGIPNPLDVINRGSRIITNNPLLNALAPLAAPVGGGQVQDLTEWDAWRAHFVAPPIPPASPTNPNRNVNQPYSVLQATTGPASQHAAAEARLRGRSSELARRAAITEQRRDNVRVLEIQREERKRLEALAREWFGRDPSPAEMHQLWMQAVDEAEAASRIGIRQTPWDALEHMAKREDRPGARAGPRTTTSTHTTISLTDPTTAMGIIQTALRDALGRRATDAEVEAFTATLNSLERENPTVTTSTSTTTPDGDTTSTSTTTGGAPSPTAVAQTYLDDELNAEIDVYRAATEYFRVAQALAGGIV